MNEGNATFFYLAMIRQKKSIFTNIIALELYNNLHISQKDGMFILWISLRDLVKFTKLVNGRLKSQIVVGVYHIIIKGLLSRGMSVDRTQLESHSLSFSGYIQYLEWPLMALVRQFFGVEIA